MTNIGPSISESFTLAEFEDARKLFAGPINFVKGVTEIKNLPAPNLTETCFAGRSNVGKSTLINAISGRKALARSSNTPGRTQEINYFAVGDKHLIADLPGYGYAKAPIQKVIKWQDLIQLYLQRRTNLRRVFLLIDGRHGIKDVDVEMMQLLDSVAVTFQVVMTKVDKSKGDQFDEVLKLSVRKIEKHPTAYPIILRTSSKTKAGIKDLQTTIYKLML